MPREIWDAHWILDSLTTIRVSEENKYSDIPGWEGEFCSDATRAVLLYFPRRGPNDKELWIPKSQLRISEDKQSIYASNWIIEQKGL